MIHTENTVWYKHNFFAFIDPFLLSIIFVGIRSCSEGGCMVKLSDILTFGHKLILSKEKQSKYFGFKKLNM